MKDILEDIQRIFFRMHALDKALPSNAEAKDLLTSLHRAWGEIARLRDRSGYDGMWWTAKATYSENEPQEPQMKPTYSGQASDKFWGRIDKIEPKRLRDALYVAGCALQDHETRVMQMLDAADGGGPPPRRART